VEIKLIRKSDSGVQTLGEIQVNGKHFCHTLELPWKNNQRNKSCIPVGKYKCIRHTSPRFGDCFWLQDVPGRSEILIHRGNYYTDIRGCILPGERIQDINNDGHPDVVASRTAMLRLLAALPSSFVISVEKLF